MLKSPVPVRDVGVLRASRGQRLNLLAGQLYFGRQAASVRTLLGSCVGITLWHPRHCIGGMCHFLLPHRVRAAGEGRDARFGEEAIDMMVDAMRKAGTRPHEYEAHLYGGADTFPDQAMPGLNIGERNIAHGWALIDRHGFVLQGVDVGDHVPRTVEMDLATGEVSMRRGQSMKTPRSA